MKKRTSPALILWIVALFLLSSCERRGDVEVERISRIGVTGFQDGILSLKVTLLIRNTTKHPMVVRKMTATVFYGETEGNDIRVTRKIRIPPHTEEEYVIPVEITLYNVGSLVKAFVESAVNGQKKEFHLRGTLRIRSGVLFKKIPFDEKHLVGTF